MNMRARNVAWLLPFFLTGCIFHKQNQQQVQALAPPSSSSPKPAPGHPELPPSAVTLPQQPLATDPNVEQEPVPPAKHHRHSNPPQQTAVTPPAPPENPGVSAIGQLSSGEPSDLRRETVDSLAATEHGLNGLGRTLSSQEQKTAAQIREYLKHAREALNYNDVDGAHTLSEKAKVLLSELSQ